MRCWGPSDLPQRETWVDSRMDPWVDPWVLGVLADIHSQSVLPQVSEVKHLWKGNCYASNQDRP